MFPLPSPMWLPPVRSIVTELQSGLERLFSAAYPTEVAAEMAALPEVVSTALLVPSNFSGAQSHHASTIARVGRGEMLAAWFGGTWEGAEDTGIWMARFKASRPR